MKLKNNIGIISYGSALPLQAVSTESIEVSQGKEPGRVGPALGVKQKTLPGVDEDTITLSADAALEALERFDGDRSKIGSLFIGSESHPYAVKPSGTVVAEALGLSRSLSTADLQFACKAGTQALQIVSSYVESGMNELAMAIGADTAQSEPGDALEFTAAAGAGAFIMGKGKVLARLIATTSVASDTPDFWRRPKEDHPQHGGRFTGEPAYFAHVESATQNLLEEMKMSAKDVDYVVFHTPNAKFPKAMAKKLGFSKEQLQYSLVVEKIGNTYAAASMMALINVLDHAEAGKKILVTSYGSGAGADSFLFETTEELISRRKGWDGLLEEKINKLVVNNNVK